MKENSSVWKILTVFVAVFTKVVTEKFSSKTIQGLGRWLSVNSLLCEQEDRSSDAGHIHNGWGGVGPWRETDGSLELSGWPGRPISGQWEAPSQDIR